MAKSTRNHPASRGGLTLLEEDAFEEAQEAVSPRRNARDSVDDVRLPEETLPRLRPFRPEEAAPEDDPFLRVRRRVPVRRGLLPSWTHTRWGKFLFFLLVLAVFAAGAMLVFTARNFFLHNGQFRIHSSEAIQTVGSREVSRDALLSVFGGDIGRNIFFVPLARRRAELEAMPWVKNATVMRILPDQLRVSVVERKPVAFLQTGSRISLIDAQGIVLKLPPEIIMRDHFSFPVITGLNPDMSQAERAARVGLYLKFLHALDSGGKNISSQISEVDLSDPEDVRATLKNGSGDLLLHFGHGNFLARYHLYASNIQNWLSQYPALKAVDLRYNNQVVLTMAHPVGSSTGNTAKPQQAQAAKSANGPASPAGGGRP